MATLMPQLSQPLALLLLVALGPYVWLVWRHGRPTSLPARLSLACRLSICALLALAVAGPTLQRPVDRQAVVFVGDLSASVADGRGQQEGFIAQAVAAKRPDDAFAVVATARQALVERVLATSGTFAGFQSAPPSDGTNLADGLGLAGALLPAAYRGRVVLLSDGQETSGDAVAQARLLRTRGAEVDVVPLAIAGGPEVLVDQVTTPSLVHEGERFSVVVRLVANVATTARVHVSVDGAPLEDQVVNVTPGTTEVAFGTRASSSGFLDVRATVAADLDTLAQNNEARAVVEVQGPPRVLIVEQRPGEGANVAAALAGAGMRVEARPATSLPEQPQALATFAAVVLADVSAEGLSDGQQTALRSYVRDLGRGLLAIGGDTSFGQGGYLGTPLDDALPVRSSVRAHRDQGRVAVALVIDRSGSMADDPYHEGTTKLDMARQAALLSAQQLGPRDLVGVLAFESTQEWIVPLASVQRVGLPSLQDRLAALTAGGGTDVYPALAAAFETVRQSDAQYKHVILMTDGISCCGGDYAGLTDKMHAANVTLSTIGVGEDADQQLLSQLAHQGDGRYYFAGHARDIPRLMTRETNLATHGPVVEGSVAPRQVAADATLADLARGGLPPLRGYLVTSPKELADVLLASDAGDPLLARWQYGLGRAAAWTSDLRGRWSDAWIGWPGMPRLFAALVGWIVPPAQGPLQARLWAGPDSAHIAVEETEPGGTPAAVRARVARPGAEPLDVALAATAPGHYEGELPLTGPGSYMVRVEEQRDGGPVAATDAGLAVSYAAEYRRVMPDPARLERIAGAGGGHVLASPAAAFADDLPPVSEPLPLERPLLALAAVLLPLDVALRRLRVSPADVLAWLRHPTRAGVPLTVSWRPASTTRQPVAPGWLPGARRTRRVPPAARAAGPPAVGLATPAAARQADADADAAGDEDALAHTLRWLAARRRGGGS